MLFYSSVKKHLEMICNLWSSCLGLNVLKASFPHACYYHDYSNPLHIRKQHVFPTCLLTWLLKITHQHENMIFYEMITKCCNQSLRYCLAYFGDKCEILIHITFWQKVNSGGIYQIIVDSTVVSKNIGQVVGMSLNWKPRVVMTPTLSSPRLSLWWQLAGTTVMTKLALRQFWF